MIEWFYEQITDKSEFYTFNVYFLKRHTAVKLNNVINESSDKAHTIWVKENKSLNRLLFFTSYHTSLTVMCWKNPIFGVILALCVRQNILNIYFKYQLVCWNKLHTVKLFLFSSMTVMQQTTLFFSCCELKLGKTQY